MVHQEQVEQAAGREQVEQAVTVVQAAGQEQVVHQEQVEQAAGREQVVQVVTVVQAERLAHLQ